jgi:hypothetical protein
MVNWCQYISINDQFYEGIYFNAMSTLLDINGASCFREELWDSKTLPLAWPLNWPSRYNLSWSLCSLSYQWVPTQGVGRRQGQVENLPLPQHDEGLSYRGRLRTLLLWYQARLHQEWSHYDYLSLINRRWWRLVTPVEDDLLSLTDFLMIVVFD